MTKVLVTGGSGKMGQVIVRDLLANGYEVVSTDRKAPEFDRRFRVHRIGRH